ncbi:hypothetical protein BC834DRAFT_853612 [Gloeopeniophorella convolvens]|nr:hypothetical protein BC834DRAFT_853612 [Gloeopeniophorella convolvens]
MSQCCRGERYVYRAHFRDVQCTASDFYGHTQVVPAVLFGGCLMLRAAQAAVVILMLARWIHTGFGTWNMDIYPSTHTGSVASALSFFARIVQKPLRRRYHS